MKKRKYMRRLISIFLTGMMLVQAPLTTLASGADIFTDEIEDNLSENENQQEIFDSGTEEAVEEEAVQESFSDDISESIEFGEDENISENFEQPNEIEDKFEAAATADLMVGNYKCAINGNKITIIKYSGTDENIVVPNSLGGYEVTAIGNYAFANCTNLKTITLPEGLKTIGYNFISGTSVTNLTIPKTVTEIGYDRWMGCGATNGAASLKSVVFEEGIERIPDYICRNSGENSVLSEVRIPESVNEIGSEAFYNCAGLKEVVFGKTIRTIRSGAFGKCKGLRKIEFKENKKYPVMLENRAFLECTDIEEIIWSPSIKEVGANAFEGCISLEQVTLSKGTERIGNYAFANCTNLKTITLPEGLKTIGYNFISGTSVTNLTIPKTVTEIGYDRWMGWGATNGAESLKSIVFEEGMERIPDYICRNSGKNSVLCEVRIPESVTEIGSEAFYNCAGLKEVVFGKTIRAIRSGAFGKCKGLRKIEFKENKKYPVILENSVFLECTDIEEVIWSPSIKEVGARAFEGCISLEQVTLLKGTERIGNYAFANCTNLKTIILLEGLKTIGYNFISGTSVTNLTIPKTVTEIGYDRWMGWGATNGAESLKSIVFEEGMERIPDYICRNSGENSVLREVRIPESVTEIGNEAFYNCISITIYGYSGSYAETYAKSKNISFIALKDKKTIDISKAKISGVQEVYEYTGITIKPIPKVTLNNKQLTEKKDYNISYKKNKNIGTATITITGKGDYSGLRIIEFRITNMENDIEKSAVSFANIFAKKAKSTKGTITTNEEQQLQELRNQLTITGYKGILPNEVLEVFATSVLDALKDSNIDKYETNQIKLANQVYNQIKGGSKSGSKKIILGNGSKKITYTVNYKILAQSFKGNGTQVSFANVEWKDAKNKSYSVHIVANSKNENMKKALASYCAVLAQLNKDVWKEFLTKYITDGWKLTGLNTVKKLDDKTVSKFFDRSEKLILTICGDQNAKKALVNDAGNTLKEKLLKMSKTQFRNFIKNNIPDGDKIIAAADQYKKVIDKYNDYKKKFNKWNKTRKDSDLAKYEKAYLECQELLEVLNDSLSKVS